MSLNDNSKILEKKTTKMKIMKTKKKRKALRIHNQKKMTVTMVMTVVMEVLVEVVLLVVLLWRYWQKNVGLR